MARYHPMKGKVGKYKVMYNGEEVDTSPTLNGAKEIASKFVDSRKHPINVEILKVVGYMRKW